MVLRTPPLLASRRRLTLPPSPWAVSILATSYVNDKPSTMCRAEHFTQTFTADSWHISHQPTTLTRNIKLKPLWKVLASTYWTIAQARRLCLFSHIMRTPDEPDAKKILTAAPFDNWRRPPGRSHTTWMKTIQKDLKSSNLSLNEAIVVVQNRLFRRLMSTFGAKHC